MMDRVIAERWKRVQEQVAEACESCGRDPAEVTIIAVSKAQPLDALKEAVDAGVQHLGESYLEEFEAKHEALQSAATWHFVGQMQSRKVERVAARADVIHSFSTPRQLRRLEGVTKELAGFLQVNIDREVSKTGTEPQALDSLLQDALQFPHLRVEGLMAIPARATSPEESRPAFRRLAEMARIADLPKLSMGMSSDYEVAIQEGATHVRIGTAIFGPRR